MTATGIDFGTTNSVVAQWNGEYVEILEIGGQGLDANWRREGFELLYPSVVGTSSLRPGTLFGWEAKLRSEQAVEACKRMLREEPFVQLGGERFAATTAAAGVFHAITGAAQDEAATEIHDAVITVPANATGAARYRTREAARAAGLTVRMLLNEPTAAAIAYAHEMEVDGEFLVFDWGGGTMDSTLLLHDDGFFDEKASRGVNRLGGLEIDARLRRMVLDRAPVRGRWSDSENRMFALEIERAKILLSHQESVRVLTPDDIAVEIGQDEFSEAIQDLIDRALDPVEECLDQARIDPRDLTAVLMIGGSSQIPAVRAAVSEALDCELVDTSMCDPMTAVAEGAAICAAAMDEELKSTIRVVNTHALGTITKDREGRRKFSALIGRNQRLPQQRVKSYEPTKDNLKRLTVEVWEGDPDREVDHPDNVKLTDLILTYPRQCRAEDGVFDLEYAYSKEGLLTVRATLQKTGEVVLDGEVKVFGDGNVLPEVRKELDRLLALAPAARSVTTPTHRQRAGADGRSSGVAKPAPPRSAAPTAAAPVVAPPLVIDGSNLAWNGRPPRAVGGKPSFAALQAAVRSLRFKHPDSDIHVVVDATLRHDVSTEERPFVEAAIADGSVVQPPAGTEGRGDALVISIAHEVGGLIVSNDNFAPFQRANPWLRDAGRVMGATHSQGVWVFNRRVPNPATPAQRR
ncbi:MULTISPECIES: Hsp70 family protein [Streptomyces]|uniref:Hsp70 family protein n=1 Tax=Streptomyces TaxID=1883 RepID=UPI000241A26C|nr:MULTISPECIES: Hsp70 family protein [Streptomyces]EHM26913.1 heat shock protein 70 [Streptomyces sp. W007]WTD29502.1 Hsp70 family protein [Streptomyces anulatus]